MHLPEDFRAPSILSVRASGQHRRSRRRPRTDRPRRCARGSGRPSGRPGTRTDVHRYYDPTTGEFLTVDPDVASTRQPYFYAGDDPVNATDPSGLRSLPCPSWSLVAGAAGCAAAAAGGAVAGIGEAPAQPTGAFVAEKISGATVEVSSAFDYDVKTASWTGMTAQTADALLVGDYSDINPSSELVTSLENFNTDYGGGDPSGCETSSLSVPVQFGCEVLTFITIESLEGAEEQFIHSNNYLDGDLAYYTYEATSLADYQYLTDAAVDLLKEGYEKGIPTPSEFKILKLLLGKSLTSYTAPTNPQEPCGSAPDSTLA